MASTIFRPVSVPPPSPPDPLQILSFPLEGILPAECTLVVFVPLCTVSLLQQGELIGQIQFTHSEMRVVVSLLQAAPYYCSYEELYTVFEGQEPTEKNLEKARKILGESLLQSSSQFDSHMRPVRNVISRVRLKFHTLGLDLQSILETGYILKPFSRKRADRHARSKKKKQQQRA